MHFVLLLKNRGHPSCNAYASTCEAKRDDSTATSRVVVTIFFESSDSKKMIITYEPHAVLDGVDVVVCGKSIPVTVTDISTHEYSHIAIIDMDGMTMSSDAYDVEQLRADGSTVSFQVKFSTSASASSVHICVICGQNYVTSGAVRIVTAIEWEHNVVRVDSVVHDRAILQEIVNRQKRMETTLHVMQLMYYKMCEVMMQTPRQPNT